jgi:hypothetical protein
MPFYNGPYLAKEALLEMKTDEKSSIVFHAHVTRFTMAAMFLLRTVLCGDLEFEATEILKTRQEIIYLVTITGKVKYLLEYCQTIINRYNEAVKNTGSTPV